MSPQQPHDPSGVPRDPLQSEGFHHPRYVLLERLGQGGMGVVFRALDRLSGQHVALKRVRRTLPDRESLATQRQVVSLNTSHGQTPDPLTKDARSGVDLTMPAQTSRTPTFREETLVTATQDQLGLSLGREFRTLASLRHPTIVSVYDYGFEAPSQPYFTMELLPDALPLVRVAQRTTLSERVQMLLQVLQALTYLHRRGILHRDFCIRNYVEKSNS